MKKLMQILGIALLFSSCSDNQAQQQGTGPENVEVSRFKELVESGEGIILDVRTPEEVNGGFISGASTINFYDDDFSEKINLIQKDKPIYVYCKSGGRSGQAADVLVKNGFAKVYNLKGGIMAWDNSGFPLEKPDGAKDEKIQQISLDDFQKMLETDKPVLVDFHTRWCVPCKKMAPVVDRISEQFSGKAVVLRIDIDKSKDVAKHYQIKGIPVFILFKNKEEKWRHCGIIEEGKIVSELTKF